MSAMRVLVASEDQQLLKLFNEVSSSREHSLVLIDEAQLLVTDQAPDHVYPDLIVIDLDGRNSKALRMLEELAARLCTSTVLLTGSCNPRTLGAAHRVGLQRGLRMTSPLTKPAGQALVPAFVLDMLRTDNLRIRPRDVEAALEHDQLRLYYHPLVELRTGRIWGAEALLRWQHPEYGLLQPASIIPVAEKHELIGPITRWVAREAMAQQVLWSAGGANLRMTINVSAQVLRNPDFADEIAEMAAQTGAEPADLVLEITESQVLTEEIEVLDTLTRLRLDGIELAVDDFGTGYSSLGRLHRMPFSELKIDKSFVMDAAHDADAEVIVRAISELGRNLNMTVIAEGVATREAWDLVDSVGCDVAQGYFIARPLSANDFAHWMTRWGGGLGNSRGERPDADGARQNGSGRRRTDAPATGRTTGASFEGYVNGEREGQAENQPEAAQPGGDQPDLNAEPVESPSQLRDDDAA